MHRSRGCREGRNRQQAAGSFRAEALLYNCRPPDAENVGHKKTASLSGAGAAAGGVSTLRATRLPRDARRRQAQVEAAGMHHATRRDSATRAPIHAWTSDSSQQLAEPTFTAAGARPSRT